MIVVSQGRAVQPCSERSLTDEYRFSGFTFLFFVLFTAFFAWQIITYALGIMRLVDMYRFYTHLLHIPDVSAGFVYHGHGC